MAHVTNWEEAGTGPHFGSPSSSDTATRSTKIDLERDGRDIEPMMALASARKRPIEINVGREERLISMVSGAALIAFGISRRNWAGLALAAAGSGLALRGFTGHCPMYSAAEISTSTGDSRETKGVHVEDAITIDKPAAELYSFWRDFENQALISDYIVSVTTTGPKTSHWVVNGPANTTLQWDAEVINEIPNELIAWQTYPGADIEHAGSVRFKPAPGGRGTEVRISMQYYPPAGVIGAGAAMVLHREPSIQAADTLKRLKRLMETGDVVSVVGQSHGKNLQRAVLYPKA